MGPNFLKGIAIDMIDIINKTEV